MALVAGLVVGVDREGQPVDVGGPKQQAVLAVLASSAGHRVSTDRLVDLVWHEIPPASASHRQVPRRVIALRIGYWRVAGTRADGETLNVDRGSVDPLVSEDQAADPLAIVGFDLGDEAQGLADVLSTWEPPLQRLRGTSPLGELAAPFEEFRSQAVEGLAAAQIAGTSAGDAVKMLEALGREHPTRRTCYSTRSRPEPARPAGCRTQGDQRAHQALHAHFGVHPSVSIRQLGNIVGNPTTRTRLQLTVTHRPSWVTRQ